MTSNADKGRDKEKDVKNIHIGWGYEVERTRKAAVWVKGRVVASHNDFFGCMDLICMMPSQLKFIQVTDDEHYRVKMTEILQHAWPISTTVEIWAWYGGRKRKNKTFKDGKTAPWVKAQLYDVWFLNHDTKQFEKRPYYVDADGTRVPYINGGSEYPIEDLVALVKDCDEFADAMQKARKVSGRGASTVYGGA